MGYALAMAPCIGCGLVFAFNPMRVPSVTVRGTREPICRSCVEIANPHRIANGLAPIVPLLGAYEDCDEAELS